MSAMGAAATASLCSLFIYAPAHAQMMGGHDHDHDHGTQALMVNMGDTYRLSDCDLHVSSLHIMGRFVVDNALGQMCDEISIAADNIMVMGSSASFEVGSEDTPFDGSLTITLTGDTGDDALINGVHDRFFMVMRGASLNLHGNSRDKVSWTQLGSYAGKGATLIDLAEPVNWEVGDEIVIAPSGMEAQEAEQRTITNVAAGGTVITLDEPLTYNHFGKILSYGGKDIDMRAEVGLLSRNIVILGDDQSASTETGGHLMVMNDGRDRPARERIRRNAARALKANGISPDLPRPTYQNLSTAQIEGVEFRMMGQLGRQGRYPIHFHLLDDGSPSYVRNNSVHHSFNRAVVMHGTNNMRVTDNVAYHVKSHMFVFAEEGDEMFNELEGNLGVLNFALSQSERAFTGTAGGGRFEQEEPRAGIFWGQNMHTRLHNNVAAGSVKGNGFFLDTNAISKELALYQRNETDGEVCNFVGNRAHSIHRGLGSPDLYAPRVKGFGVFLEDVGRLRGANGKCTIKDFSAYKVQFGGAWLEQGAILDNAIISDAHIGIVDGQTIQDTVLIGQSENLVGGSYSEQQERRGRLRTVTRHMGHPQKSRGGIVFNAQPGARQIGDQTITDVTCIDMPSCLFFSANRGDDYTLQVSDIDLSDVPHPIWVSTRTNRRSGERVVSGRLIDDDGSLTGAQGTYEMIDPALVSPGHEPILFGWPWREYYQ